MKQTVYRVEAYDKESGRYYNDEVYSKPEAQKKVFDYIVKGYFARIVEKEVDIVQKEFEDCFDLLCNQMDGCVNCPYGDTWAAEDCYQCAREDAKTDADKLLIISKMMKAIHY